MKLRANIIKRVGDKVAFLIHAEDVYLLSRIDKYTEKDLLSIEIKKYKPVRTLTQNAFFHLLCDYIGHELGMDKALVKEGIKEKYGVRIKLFDKLVPKPSSQCNKFEEMSKLIEGCFIEAGEQGIDMTEWIMQWMGIRKNEKDNKDGIYL